MTIAVAVKKGSEIVLAADSQDNFGDHRESLPNHSAAKILKIGESLIATSGWGVYSNILEDYGIRHHLSATADDRTIFRFFLKFWKELHEHYSFVNDQCEHEEKSPFGDLDAEFLVVNRRGLFKVCSDMSVTEFNRYTTVGSGGDYAMGAMYALYESELDAEALARRSVDAAIHFDLRCGGETRLFKLRAMRQAAAARTRKP